MQSEQNYTFCSLALSIDSYGGSPAIVASYEEIRRVATEIHRAKNELVFFPVQLALENPLLAVDYQLGIAPVIEKLSRLENYALLAAENYFTTEAQIARRFEFAYIPELAAIALSGVAALGWRLDSDVTATKTRETKAVSPAGITHMLDRLWKISSRENATIAVDTYVNSSGSKTAVVYVPGTQRISFGSNPLDMASNLQAMAGAKQAASEKAVLLAISQAGIGSEDEVILVGHSQGGMVAANIASTPQTFLVSGLVTFGAPIAHLAKLKTPVLAVEHVNDPVPNISSRANPLKANWVTVQRVSEKSESNALAFSHSLKSYRNTALEIDASKDVGITNVRSKVLRELQNSKPNQGFEFEITRANR